MATKKVVTPAATDSKKLISAETAPSIEVAQKLNSSDAPLNSNTVSRRNLTKKEIIAGAKRISKPYRVTSDKKFKLKDFPAKENTALSKTDKPEAVDVLQQGVQLLAQMQDKLYAQDKWALLIIFQAMDAAGKDGAIKHVMSGINPQGCEVTAFKAPNSEELDHDYLWRCMKHLPERGRIGIFNRSYYEEVLVVRVHDSILRAQKLPEKLITESIWDDRLSDIRNFESYLNHNGIVVLKIFLNVSKKEQKKRFLERIDKPEKNWKFSSADLKERKFWKQYQEAYEDMIKNTATEKSPWYVVPADDKPYARILIASAIINALDSMKLAYPVVSEEQVAELQRLKQELLMEKG
jgi:PPK2 family polyphosphate:nucleotide phosphotransferase